MNVLVLSPYPDKVVRVLEQHGDRAVVRNDRPEDVLASKELYSFVLCYGYRYLFPPKLVRAWDGLMANLHISMLPWNRGADPNFWSFYDDTPKGVSLHYIDIGIDTGDIVAQHEVVLSENATLASSYSCLQDAVVALFARTWPALRAGQADRLPQSGKGTAHRSSDLEPLRYLLADGWETPVARVVDAGRQARSST